MSIRVIQTQAAMVIEQDFILQIRRLQKLNTPHYVFNIALSTVESLAASAEQMDAVHDKLQAVAAKLAGTLYTMTNADSFMVLPASVSTNPDMYIATVLKAVMPDTDAALLQGVVKTYLMPRDYVPLRERVNHYMDVAKDIASNKADDPERNLQAAAVQGPLTAYALSQIERLVDDIDMATYARTQRVMARQANGQWALHYTEYFISLHDMQREKFPRLEMEQSARLVAELGAVLDRRMLAHMLSTEGWQGGKVGLNLSAKTVLSSTFAQFCHVVQGAARHNVTFEINISDVFSDITTFHNAADVLKKEGFRIALEGVVPAMLPLLNVGALAVDDVKVKASTDVLPMLVQPTILQALRHIAPEAVILHRVDNQQALDIGASLGITKFQGFYIDESVK